MRKLLANALRRGLVARGADLTSAELAQATLVCAPHPDDETLGCGGTIRKRVEAGARVQVVFLTDGSASHAQHVTKSVLARERQGEARRAGNELGLVNRDLHFFDFPDGELGKHRAAATLRMRELLLRTRPRAVYVPHGGDGPADHEATTQVVLHALCDTGLRVTVFEYPVWLWHSFPWVGLRSARGLRRGVLSAARAQRAWLADMRCVVPLGQARAYKLKALECYASQMSRPRDKSDWATLGQIAGGDFLRALLSEHEFFHRYDVEDVQSARPGELRRGAEPEPR